MQLKPGFYLISLFVAALVLAAGSPVAAQQKTDATVSSYERARRTLDAGIEALGGLERLRSATRVTVSYRGLVHPPGQNAAFDAPPLNVPLAGARTMIDYTGQRYVTEGETQFPGGYRFNFRQVITPQRSFRLDLLKNRLGNTIQNLPAPQQASIKLGSLLEMPHLLLLYARDRAATLRWLGEETSSGRRSHVIVFAAEDGSQVALHFDAATRLPVRFEQLGSQPLLGDVLTVGVYDGYRALAGVKVPLRRNSYFAGDASGENEYAEVAFDFAAAEPLLAVPPGYVEPTPPSGEAAEPLRRMGDGIYLIEGLGYRVMFVVFKDHVMVLETPTNANLSQLVIERIGQTAPGKPIRYVSFSHFHIDHTGGLRQYIAEGATVVVPPGNRLFVETIAKSKLTIRPDALALKPVAPKIETFERKRIFTDGERTLELYNIGPVSHVRDMVIFYFPKEKILFQGDMFSPLESGGMAPVIEINRELARKVAELGLEVETLVAVHAGVIQWRTFREAVSAVAPK